MLLLVSSSPEIHKIAQQQEPNRRVAKCSVTVAAMSPHLLRHLTNSSVHQRVKE
jgi:hypothetical protein